MPEIMEHTTTDIPNDNANRRASWSEGVRTKQADQYNSHDRCGAKYINGERLKAALRLTILIPLGHSIMAAGRDIAGRGMKCLSYTRIRLCRCGCIPHVRHRPFATRVVSSTYFQVLFVLRHHEPC